MVKRNNKKEKSLQVGLDDGNEISINSEKSGIKLFLVGSAKVMFAFDSSDIKGLSFLHDDPLKYLLGQITLDSSVDEVWDTCESIKDNVKQLYKENPHLINYSKVSLSEDLYQKQNEIMEKTTEWQSKNNGLPEILTGTIILLSFILFADSLENFADMNWEDGWVNVLKFPLTFLFGVAPVIILLWPIVGIAMIIDGYKKYK